MTKLDEYYEFVSRRNYPGFQVWKKWGEVNSASYISQQIYMVGMVARYERGEDMLLTAHRSVLDFLAQLDMSLAVAALGEGYFE